MSTAPTPLVLEFDLGSKRHRDEPAGGQRERPREGKRREVSAMAFLRLGLPENRAGSPLSDWNFLKTELGLF